MLNLFYSESYWSHTDKMNGPQKVVKNLIQSLDDCGIVYSINKEEYEYTLMLHWDLFTINNQYKHIKNKKNLIIGPQISPWVQEFNQLEEYKKVIAPSKPTEKIYNKFFPKIKTGVWPVAIYSPQINLDNIKTDCLVYYKNRSVNDLQLVLNFLEKRNISYTGLEYGNYNQQEFKESLSEVKYCIIIDNTESQGIAIQEMMSVNKPLFVWRQIDGVRTDYKGINYNVQATTIPYWSAECGEYIDTFNEFETKFNLFLTNIHNYSPQKFIKRELSPQKTIEILFKLFQND